MQLPEKQIAQDTPPHQGTMIPWSQRHNAMNFMRDGGHARISNLVTSGEGGLLRFLSMADNGKRN